MERRKTVFAVAFLAPSVLLYSVLVIGPLVASIGISFTDWKFGRPASFVGLDNFVRQLTEREFQTVIGNTFSLVAAAVLIQVPLALVVAYFLSLMARGFRFFRSVFFLPVVIAPIAIGLMFSIIYNGDVGPLNQALRQVGLASFAKSWLGDKSTVLAAVTVPQVWQYVGFYMVIFLAAIRSVPREILESAAIDGANRVQTFTRIILPMLREVIVICMTLAVTGGLRAFDHSWVMTKGGPGIASSYIATLVYRRGMLDGSLGYGSSLTVTLLVLALIAAYGVRRIGKARP